MMLRRVTDWTRFDPQWPLSVAGPVPFPEVMPLNIPGRLRPLSRSWAVTATMLLSLTAAQVMGASSSAAASGASAHFRPAPQMMAAAVSTAPPSTLVAGQTLMPGAAMVAPGGHVVMVMQPDGNLVEHRDQQLIWATYTQGNPGAWAIMQPDGNFVIYSHQNKPLWHTHTFLYPGAHISLQADTYFVVYSTTMTPLWWRDIGRGAALCNSTAPNPAGTAITRWNPVTLCVLQVLRLSSGSLADVNTMIYYESSGNPNAINLWDINAKEGHPSKGLIQVIQSTFDRFHSLQLSSDLFNPAANLYAGLNYATYTYGSIHNIPGLVSLRAGGRYKGYILQG